VLQAAWLDHVTTTPREMKMKKKKKKESRMLHVGYVNVGT
jgi:hypothetical protein